MFEGRLEFARVLSVTCGCNRLCSQLTMIIRHFEAFGVVNKAPITHFFNCYESILRDRMNGNGIHPWFFAPIVQQCKECPQIPLCLYTLVRLLTYPSQLHLTQVLTKINFKLNNLDFVESQVT